MRRPPVAAPHRTRPTHAGCADPRAAARAAAVRRRHILLAAVAVGLLVALAVPWGGKGGNGLASPGPIPGTTLSAHTVYVVQPGDTLWSIAERLAPQGDPRPAVTTLSEQLGGDTVTPGERLLLP
ncbi:MAG TPA: LysM peptidoglycan-binding domain-containing protein [Acidimicrobiales bacterium]|nr:LysM peptidoglycan-binding domain-containing protein [Acidimicrobiales bacterium]